MYFIIFIIFSIFSQVYLQIDMGFDPRCPAVDEPLNPVHLPHESDCELFYKCSNTHRILFQCPAQLHWSVVHDRCEWPSIANCDPEMLPPLPSTTQRPIEPECPAVDNPQVIVFLPDLTRCDGYFLCFNGSKIPRSCYPGLYWDQSRQWCDLKEKVNCVLA